MFKKTPRIEDAALDQAIAQIYTQMADDTPESEEYAKMADQLVKLYALKKEPPSTQVSPDTLFTGLVYTFGIIVLVGYEQKNVLASKVNNFLPKLFR